MIYFRDWEYNEEYKRELIRNAKENDYPEPDWEDYEEMDREEPWLSVDDLLD